MTVGQINQTAVLAIELLDDFVRDALPLLHKHWRELSSNPDILLKPDFRRYQQVEAAGQLRIYTARIDGELVGYCVFTLDYNLHYSDSLQAHQDVLYVHPDHRRSQHAIRLLHFAEQQLRADSVQLITQHVKLAHPGLATLLRRMKYRQDEILFTKRIDR